MLNGSSPNRQLFVWAVAVAVLIGATSCSSGDQPQADEDPLRAALQATAPAPPELIELLGQVAEVRGLPPPATIRFGVVKPGEVPVLLDSLLTELDRQRFARTTTLYRLLGHLTRDQDYLQVYRTLAGQAMAGLYSPAHDTLWIVDDRPADEFALARLSADARTALVHELVHAIQDANFPRSETWRTVSDDLDGRLALAALIEGDAVAHSALFAARQAPGGGPGPRITFGQAASPAGVPPSLVRELFFPYTTGAEWVYSELDEGGSGAVNSLLLSPPSSTATVLHAGPWRTSLVRESVSLPDLSRALGEAWKHESGGTFGEFQLRNYLQLRLPGLPASTAADGWAGDHYDVYTRGVESVVVIRVVFADNAQADEFRAAHDVFLTAGGGRRQVKGSATVSQGPSGTTTVTFPPQGREVTFVIGGTEDVALRVSALLQGG